MALKGMGIIMEKHPLGDLMETTMSKLREMVDVNTIIGTPVTTTDGITLIPVSKVSLGFASGGSDFAPKRQSASGTNPFGGGSGAGVSIVPVAFVVIKDASVRILPLDGQSDPLSKAIDMTSEIVDKIKDMITKKKDEEKTG